MPNFISEDQIEQAILQRLQFVHGYDVENFHTENREDPNDGSNRTSKREVILHDRLRAAAQRLNPDLPETAIDAALKTLCDRRRAMPMVTANREVYDLIRDGVRVDFRDADGRNRIEQMRVIDFKDPQANEFLAVSQMWIQGEVRYRRPDILLYINGLPLVFIELKNSSVKLRNACDDNLTDYKADIPQLFLANAFCVLSNAIDTRVGSITAGWQHFFRWLRPEDEKEKIDRAKIVREGTSAERLLAGLCPKDKLIDYIENFILFHGEDQKIIAQNHQFIGVNKGFDRFVERGQDPGKLGVYWHTQGSGKSFSMIFYTRKILRKCGGSPTFVVVTDREDLDGQIYRTFLNTGTVKKSEAAQPRNGEEMRKFLGQSKRLVFTLIQKFHWPQGGWYPLLSDRDDIIVIVDEAHRSQYKTFAENMRAGLPNARYLAFTGTPLLGRQRKTNAWFGDYVSEYNFRQSMDDGATVPLYYKKRVPEMHNQNDELDAEFYEILEDENLDAAQKAKLEDQFASELELIRRPDRLEAIARDVVRHFPHRGYLGKGLFIVVDKVTAVKMHDLVQRFWKEEIKNLRGRINNTTHEVEKQRLKRTLEYMRSVKLQDMLKRNRTRGAFAERLQGIIDEYNSGSSSTDRIFEELTQFLGEMGEEDKRHTRLGLTEDELEIYDLLKKEKMSQSEEKKVRLAAKALLKRLLEEAPKVLVQDSSPTDAAFQVPASSAAAWTPLAPSGSPRTGLQAGDPVSNIKMAPASSPLSSHASLGAPRRAWSVLAALGHIGTGK